jgi:2,3-dihydroxyphenylpropionate 1,2-dioxygenase
MNNMPAFAIGMADSYEGPIEDEAFLKIPHTKVRVTRRCPAS